MNAIVARVLGNQAEFTFPPVQKSKTIRLFMAMLAMLTIAAKGHAMSKSLVGVPGVDPILGLPTGMVVAVGIAIESIVATLLLFGRPLFGAWALALSGILFSSYHLTMWIHSIPGGCSCVGLLFGLPATVGQRATIAWLIAITMGAAGVTLLMLEGKGRDADQL
jgi:hypothetical protein